LHPFSH